MAFRGDLDALVLAVLQNGATHGYEISRRINSQGDEAIRVKENQLYPILHRLEAGGSIEAEWIVQEGKPSRKVYRLTDAGRGLLEKKRGLWEQFAQSVSTLMAGHPLPDGGRLPEGEANRG